MKFQPLAWLRDLPRPKGDDVAAIEAHNLRMNTAPGLGARPTDMKVGLAHIAAWFDHVYNDAGTGDDVVQQDLRQWVNDICALESQLNFWQELSRRFNRELDGIGMSTCEPVDINIRNMGQRIREQAAEIEKLRMQLAACGVAAMANTSATAPLARNVSPEYNSASLQDVCRAVDREMAQRAQVAFLEVKVQTMEAEIQRNRAIICATQEGRTQWNAAEIHAKNRELLAKLEEIEKLLTKANALGWEGQVNTLPIRVAQVVSSRDDAWRVNDIRLKLINELSDDNAKLLAKLEKQEIIIAAVRVQQDMVKAAQVVGASVFKELWVELLGYAKQLNELSMTTAEPYMVARNIAGKMFTGPIACLKQLESMNARSVETPKAGVESGTK